MTKCKYCGQPTKPGRHKPDEYQHAQGCPKGPKQLGSKAKCRVCKDDASKPCPWCASLKRIARARKAGSTVTPAKQAASRANLAKGRRKMDPDIKRIMKERGVTRQRAHQINNARDLTKRLIDAGCKHVFVPDKKF